MAMAKEDMFYNSGSNVTRSNNVRRANVPAPSRAATARKLEVEETIAPDTDKIEQIAALEAKRDQLISRLDVGASRIEEARAKGEDVTNWEDHWIQLLRHYEKVCNNLREVTAQ